VDYWSVGIILYEIFYGNIPFGNSTRDVSKIYKEILENKPFLTSSLENKSFNNLISSLLCKKPSSRISCFKDIKNHEFFKNYDFEKLLNFNFDAPYTPDEYINQREYEFLKNEFTPLLNFIQNCVYQNSTEIVENMWKHQLDDLLSNF
jgi:serine/threonine protein kinase